MNRVWFKVWPGVVGVGEQALPHRHQATATAVKGVGGAGVFTSLVGDCNKIATWNVRSLYVSGKLANVLSEMKRMGIGIMGVAETCWDGEGSFPAEIPESEGGDKYKVFFSGGKTRRRGVGVIVREEVVKSVMSVSRSRREL